MLDEPTSGLDTQTALGVMLILRRLADAGISIVLTLHQPSTQIFSMCDSLCLLDAGRPLYFGARADAAPYLAKLGLAPSATFNVADYLLGALLSGGEDVRARLASAYDELIAGKETQHPGELPPPLADDGPVYERSFARQATVLGRRSFALSAATVFVWSNLVQVSWALVGGDCHRWLRVVPLAFCLTRVRRQVIVMTLCVSFFWYSIPFTLAAMRDLAGCVHFIGAFVSFFIPHFNSVNTFQSEQAVVLRERELRRRRTCRMSVRQSPISHAKLSLLWFFLQASVDRTVSRHIISRR